eukprot:scaffold69097_cov30-Prasinocladus_malaysianus.AAC.1
MLSVGICVLCLAALAVAPAVGVGCRTELPPSSLGESLFPPADAEYSQAASSDQPAALATDPKVYIRHPPEDCDGTGSPQAREVRTPMTVLAWR